MADHLRLLNNNDESYNKLLEHKIHQKVQNEELLKQLQQRKYETNSIVEDFECFVCQRSVDGTATASTIGSEPRKPGDMCGAEPIYPKMRTKVESSNANVIKLGKCEADLLHEMIVNNRPYTNKQLHDELIARFDSGICKH